MKMNWPNRLSLIRIASVPVITLLLVLNKPWAMYVALFGFIFAAITDFVKAFESVTFPGATMNTL